MSMISPEFTTPYYELANRFLAESKREVEDRSRMLSEQGLIIKEHEVLLGFLSRQCYLAAMLTHAMSSWHIEFGATVTRSMIELHISASWIALDLEKRARMYINHGLGQQKLLVEKLKMKLKNEGKSPETDEAYLNWKAWLESEMNSEFVEVDVANWSGKSIREMAEEAKLKEMFDFVYQPLSFVAHGTWNFIARAHLKVCSDPLHGFHRIPRFPERYFDLSIPRDAVKNYERMLNLYDRSYKIDVPSCAAQNFNTDFDRLVRTHEETNLDEAG